MERIIDVVSNNMTTVNISKGKYEDLIVSGRLLNDFFDLIAIREKKNQGISVEEVKLIYEMHIKRVDDEEEECDGEVEGNGE